MRGVCQDYGSDLFPALYVFTKSFCHLDFEIPMPRLIFETPTPENLKSLLLHDGDFEFQLKLKLYSPLINVNSTMEITIQRSENSRNPPVFI